MLKSIVNGAEHDIVRIPMKGKNLFDISTQAGQIYVTDSVQRYGVEIPVSSGTYTVSGGTATSFAKTKIGDVYGEPIGLNAPRVFTLASDGYMLIYASSQADYDGAKEGIMLNSGSTALPYEPYGYQNGWEVRDNQNRLIWGREDELQTTTGTLMFNGYALPIKVKSLLGSATQNGTPSPDNVVVPEFCGVRTENLFNGTKYVYTSISSSERWEYHTSLTGSVYRIPCKPNTTYKLYLTENIDISIWRIRDVSTDDVPNTQSSTVQITGSYADSVPASKSTIFTTSSNAKYILFQTNESAYADILPVIMLVEGSTDLQYEPYGYKIPFTCAGQTTPIYLGEVPTIRRIKKLVFDGTETWNKGNYPPTGGYQFFTPKPSDIIDSPPSWIISHFKKGNTLNGSAFASYLSLYPENSILPENATISDFKNWLAAQYAAGTPVTIWYILAEQETGIVNEPLAKIGNHADELTEISVHNLSAPLYGIGDYKDILNLYTGVVTRKIKKLVFNGSEPWVLSGNIIYIYNTNTEKLSSLICTHFPNVQNTGMWNGNNWVFQVDISNLGMTTHSAWITYLQQQYASGTPVTVWYILETTETETVTVPTGMTGEIEGHLTQISTPTPEHPSIPKWNGKEETGGTYAVTVYTPPEISTTTGQNKLTVDTTLAPYNVTINGHIRYTYWGKIREDVRSGLAQTKFPVGTILYDNEDETTGRAFQVVGYDKHFDPSLTERGYNHSMTLCQLKLSGPWQYDAIEAFLYTTVEMQPGTYKFKIPNYGTTYGGNKTYYFTSTATVPVDSQITLSWEYPHPPSTVTAYAGPNPQTNTTAITGFNALTLTEWVEGESPEAIDLGIIKLANNDPDSTYGKLNHIHRARYGSNNYYQSGLRQLLNTDLASNNWWHPTTIFDRPYGNRTTNGYLRSLNEDFINVLATPEITHIANNLFEYPSLDGRTFALNTEYKINTDKVFLLSHTEVGLSSSPNVGTVLDYYSTHNTNNDRIKYRIDNGNAYYWWFRTPHPSTADLLRFCVTSGALNSNYAYSNLCVAPAHIIQ